ncbi:tetratricopeptide repeat protein [Usitatibacter palustris]|uniref:Tetratricopeptide repeat protein n=1 Tax=Usitatibacter palustris TaxID=2732487 RepID=A0A6M4H8G7_9PROT|nr:hypothetical protein [Usitatibacter palustris]QJR14297.1 hypothetical protein DSM104440_01090 [Usitatibacter palustris]
MKAIQGAALVAALALVAGCGKFGIGGPKTSEEALKGAKAALATGDVKSVYDLCGRAIELADKVGNGMHAILALECYADSAARLGKTASTLPAYAKVIGTYPTDMLNAAGRFRLRNDYGVALYQAGKEDEAIAALNEALTVYKGTGRAGYNTVRDRMYIVRNLGKIYKKKGVTPAATEFAIEWADEIEADISRNGPHPALRMGSGSALEVLADIISATDSTRAGQAREVATAEKESEAAYAAANPGSDRRCHNMGIYGAQMQRCFVDLP